MKKKLTGVLALSMAMALTFGMTVCAAESPSTSNTETAIITDTVAAEIIEPDAAKTEELTKQAGDLSAKVTNVAVETPNSAVTVKETKAVTPAVLNNVVTTVADKVAEKVVAATEGKTEGKTITTTVQAAVDIVIEGDIPEEGITMTISVPGFTRTEGKKYIVLHLNEVKNVWETVKADVVDGQITATFTSLSPIVLVEVDVKDDESASNNNSGSNNNTSAPAATSPAESPKTGETLPVAGILAVVCLASAAVCAKKVCYNR